jgi:hypothetical protein
MARLCVCLVVTALVAPAMVQAARPATKSEIAVTRTALAAHLRMTAARQREARRLFRAGALPVVRA